MNSGHAVGGEEPVVVYIDREGGISYPNSGDLDLSSILGIEDEDLEAFLASEDDD